MKVKYFFYGYLDNKAITNSFLIPIYKVIDKEEYYFHDISKDNRVITDFRKFELNSYKRDIIVVVKDFEDREVKINEEPFFVIKYKDKAVYDRYANIIEILVRLILRKEITSKILIKNIQKKFGQSFYKSLRRNTLNVYSSFRGLSRGRLNDYLYNKNLKGLLSIVDGSDKKFISFYQYLIDKNVARTLVVPTNVLFTVSRDSSKVVFKKKDFVYEIVNKDPFDIEISKSRHFQENEGDIKYWEIRAKNGLQSVYLISKSDQSIAIIANELNEKFGLISKENSRNSRNSKSSIPPKKALKSKV